MRTRYVYVALTGRSPARAFSALTVAAAALAVGAAGVALAGCTQNAGEPLPVASASANAPANASSAPPAASTPATSTPATSTAGTSTAGISTAAGYPITADAYTHALVVAWQAHDLARMTDLAGPHVAAFLDGLKAPTTVAPFEDATDSGRTSVHLVGDQDTLEIDITVDYIDSGFGKPHAIVDITDANVNQTIKG